VVEGPFDFNSKDDMARIRKFREGLTDAMVDRDSAAYVKYLDSRPQTDRRRKMGVQGFCMSGPIAFRTAAVRPDRIGAVATFHPGALVTDKPSSPHLLIPKSRAAYLVIIAKNDAEKMPKEKPDLDAALGRSHGPREVKVCAAHRSCPVSACQYYDEKEAERAWAELLPFYRAHLR
jgi:carboxymethylenebutenolidase